MHELYELKDKILKELKAYSRKGEITASSLTMIDTLAHALKNIDKIIEKCEEEDGYSSRPSFESGSMRGAYSGRRYARRDAMGRYSRDGYSGDDDMSMELQDLMRNAPDERTRQKIQNILDRMER